MPLPTDKETITRLEKYRRAVDHAQSLLGLLTHAQQTCGQCHGVKNQNEMNSLSFASVDVEKLVDLTNELLELYAEDL